jgi:hypothetical protein
MSDNIQENRKKISQLRKLLVNQLINNSWSGESDLFHNDYFQFYINGGGIKDWRFKIQSSYESYKVSDFINPLLFWFLRIFYVKKSLRNYHKLKKEAQLASVSKKFFSNNKDLDRDSKLNELLK